MKDLKDNPVKPFEPINNTRAISYPKMVKKYNATTKDERLMDQRDYDDFRVALFKIAKMPDEEFYERKRDEFSGGLKPKEN